jgi:hypothetical protein
MGTVSMPRLDQRRWPFAVVWCWSRLSQRTGQRGEDAGWPHLTVALAAYHAGSTSWR